MPIAQALLPEFDHEIATTRRLLERVPEADAAWKPHAKSTSLGNLVAHVANLATWMNYTLDRTALNFAPLDGSTPPQSVGFESTAQILSVFDANAAAAHTALAAASDQDLMVPWSLQNGEHTIFTLPRVAVIRSFIINHLIHHRGQLSVYLRLRDVPIPSIYGPTADES